MAEGEQQALIRAAGAVIWRPGGGDPELAVVHRPRYDDWSYPKGKQKRGEHLMLTALREVSEETGLDIVLGRPLSPSTYQTAAGTKAVSYWVASCTRSEGLAPNDEVDEVAWLPVNAAQERLSYKRDVALAEEFRSAPAETTPLILLRHAEAGAKVDRGDDRSAAADLARTLDERGSADALILSDLLACYGPCRVISSAAERCLATVRPYAQAAGVQVEVEPALTITPGSRPPSAGAATRGPELLGQLAASGVATIICAHRENLPVLIAGAYGALGASPPLGEPLGKSEFLALHAAGGTLVAAERHSPLDLGRRGLALGCPLRGQQLANRNCRRHAIEVC